MSNMNFSLWFQMTELSDIWTEAIQELKFKSKLNESLSAELGHWNSAFDALFKTSGINWVNLAMSAGGGSVFNRRSEAFATVMSETLTDAYMCMSQGTNPMTRAVEKGEDSGVNECPATRKAFLELQDKPDEDKQRWFTTVIARGLRRRSETYSQRSKVIRGKKRGLEYDTYIKSGTRSNRGDDDIGRERDVTGGNVVGSGSLMDTGEEDDVRTLGDTSGEATTLMNAIRDRIQGMGGRADSKIPGFALRMLDMLAAGEISSISLRDAMDKLEIPNSTAGRVLDLIRKATEEAKADLGLLPGMSFHKRTRNA